MRRPTRLCQLFNHDQPLDHCRVLVGLQFCVLFAFLPCILGCWEEIHYEHRKIDRPAKSLTSQEAAQLTNRRDDAEIVPTPSNQAIPDQDTSRTNPQSVSEKPDEPTSDREDLAPPVTSAEISETASDAQMALPSQPNTQEDNANVGDNSSNANTELAAWRMSSEWSMAVALQAKGEGNARFGPHLGIAAQEATALGIALPELPMHADDQDPLERNLAFLLDEAGPALVQELSQTQGNTQAALAELATKTHVLLLSYVPTSPRLDPVIDSIKQAAQNSGLPETVWGELIELLNQRAEFKQVKSAVFALHRRATGHLTDPTE